MRLYHTANARPGTIQHQVRRRIRTWIQLAFHHLAVGKRDYGHVLRFHLRLRHAAWFDHHQPARAVHRTGNAPCLNDQPFADQILQTSCLSFSSILFSGSRLLADMDQHFHNVVKVPLPLFGAERVIKLFVDLTVLIHFAAKAP